MKIGIALPIGTPAFDPVMLTDVSQAAEEMGFHSLWTYDRLFWAVKPRNPYGGNINPWPKDFKYTTDPLDVLTFLAGQTKHIRLGTSVINAPFYNPVLLARRLTTIDILSNGRLKVGLGLGWSKDEYEATGVSMARRGARMDEFLQVLTAVWSEGISVFQGEFYQLPASVFDLKPVQKPHPPLILGTFNKRGLQRAGKMANGWNPAGIGPDVIKQMAGIVRQAATEAGRDADTLQIVYRTGINLREQSLDENRKLLSGNREQILDDIAALAEAGVTELFTGVGDINPERGRTTTKFIGKLEQLSQLLD